MRNYLKGELIGLRAIEPEDLDFLYAMENNPETWKVTCTYAPYSRFALRQYIENAQFDIYTTKQLRMIIYLIDDVGVSLGALDLFDFDPFHQRAGVGIIINNPVDRGKGYAKESLKLLKEYAFSYLKLKQLFASASVMNVNSVRLFESADYVPCGIRKSWLKTETGWEDEVMMQLINLTDY